MRYKIHTYPYITFSHQVTGDDQAVAPILPVSHCLILSVSHSHLLTFAHSNILIFSYSPILAFPILSFSHAQIVTPSWNRHVVPRLLFPAPLSHSPIISFTHSHIVPFSHSPIFTFSHSPILTLIHLWFPDCSLLRLLGRSFQRERELSVVKHLQFEF